MIQFKFIMFHIDYCEYWPQWTIWRGSQVPTLYRDRDVPRTWPPTFCYFNHLTLKQPTKGPLSLIISVLPSKLINIIIIKYKLELDEIHTKFISIWIGFSRLCNPSFQPNSSIDKNLVQFILSWSHKMSKIILKTCLIIQLYNWNPNITHVNWYTDVRKGRLKD